MISFIIPFQNTHPHHSIHLHNLLDHLQHYWPDNCEIVVCSQEDTKPFLRGQLLNLGVKNSTGDLLVFIDSDVRFPHKFDFPSLCSNNNVGGVCPWEFLYECELVNNQFKKTGGRRTAVGGWGGCTAMMRCNFIKCGGFSNLIKGWGSEDNILKTRMDKRFKSGLIKKKGFHMYHITHPRTAHRHPHYNRNLFLRKSDSVRIPHEDGFLQTTANTECKSCGGVTFLCHTNISTVSDFMYKGLIV